jgi:hypothetical protein
MMVSPPKGPYAFTGIVKKVVFDLKPAHQEAQKALHESAHQHLVAVGGFRLGTPLFGVARGSSSLGSVQRFDNLRSSFMSWASSSNMSRSCRSALRCLSVSQRSANRSSATLRQ